MATIESKTIIAEMLANGGVYPGDPPAKHIYRCRIRSSRAIVYNVFYDDRVDIYSAPAVDDIACLFSGGNLTPEGEEELKRIHFSEKLK